MGEYRARPLYGPNPYNFTVEPVQFVDLKVLIVYRVCGLHGNPAVRL